MKKNSSVLFICPDFFDYKDVLTNGLENKFRSVLSFSDRPECSAVEKALIKYNIFGYRCIKSFFYGKKILRTILHDVQNINEVLIVKGTCIDPVFIRELKRLNPSIKVVAYSWDSIANAKSFVGLATAADFSASFDFSDCQNFGFHYVPLFSSIPEKELSKSLCSDVRPTVQSYEYCFVGSYHGDRAKILRRLVECSNSTIESYVKIYFQSKLQYFVFYILDAELRKCPKNWITFQAIQRETIDLVACTSKKIVDIHHPQQTGLTMRTWETLKGTGRLLTTNEFVLLHESPNSVDILDRHANRVWTSDEKLNFSNALNIKQNANYTLLSASDWLDELLK